MDPVTWLTLIERGGTVGIIALLCLAVIKLDAERKELQKQLLDQLPIMTKAIVQFENAVNRLSRIMLGKNGQPNDGDA